MAIQVMQRQTFHLRLTEIYLDDPTDFLRDLSRLPELIERRAEEELGKGERLPKRIKKFFDSSSYPFPKFKRLCVQEYFVNKREVNMRRIVQSVLKEELTSESNRFDKVFRTRLVKDLDVVVGRNIMDEMIDDSNLRKHLSEML